jgi:hypothetical protein
MNPILIVHKLKYLSVYIISFKIVTCRSNAILLYGQITLSDLGFEKLKSLISDLINPFGITQLFK